MLEGAWREDAVGKITAFFQEETANRLGNVDLTRNLHRSLCRELAVRYQTPPLRLSDDDAADEALTEAVAGSALWAVLARLERYTVSANTCFLRPDWTTPEGSGPGLQYTVVTSDLVYTETDPQDPRTPVYAMHARRRRDPEDKDRRPRWFFDEWDVRGDSPTFRIMRPAKSANEQPADVTGLFMDSPDALSGVNYHWTIDGRPVVGLVPYQTDPGFAGLFDWREGCEVVEATLLEAAYWSFFGYGLRDAGHPPRALADGEFVSGGTRRGEGSSARVDMAADPTVIHLVRSLDQGAAHALEWGPGFDPERMQMAIQSWTMGAAQSAGLSPDDFQRNGQAESGYAISLKSEAKRREQRRMAPSFQASDALTLGLSASLLNRYANAGLPESGWAPQYAQVSLSPAEKAERREDVKARLEAGTASLVDAVMAEHPQMTREQATAHLEQVQAELRMFRRDAPTV